VRPCLQLQLRLVLHFYLRDGLVEARNLRGDHSVPNVHCTIHKRKSQDVLLWTAATLKLFVTYELYCYKESIVYSCRRVLRPDLTVTWPDKIRH
jgi:hypothetical protein